MALTCTLNIEIYFPIKALKKQKYKPFVTIKIHFVVVSVSSLHIRNEQIIIKRKIETEQQTTKWNKIC